MYWNVPRIVPASVNPCCVGSAVRLDGGAAGAIAFASPKSSNLMPDFVSMERAGCNLCADRLRCPCLRPAAFLLIAIVAVAAFGVAADDSAQRQVAQKVLAFHGEMGVFAKNLDTGETIAVAPDARFPTASLIKVAVMDPPSKEVGSVLNS